MLYSMRLDQDPDGDGFVFDLSAALTPGLSGGVLIRVIDTDRESGTGSDYPGTPGRNVVHNKGCY